MSITILHSELGEPGRELGEPGVGWGSSFEHREKLPSSKTVLRERVLMPLASSDLSPGPPSWILGSQDRSALRAPSEVNSGQGSRQVEGERCVRQTRWRGRLCLPLLPSFAPPTAFEGPAASSAYSRNPSSEPDGSSPGCGVPQTSCFTHPSVKKLLAEVLADGGPWSAGLWAWN